MKIIFITREGYHLAGARIRCYNFARELKKYGLQTEVFSFSDTLGAKDGVREKEMTVYEKVKYNLLALNKLLKIKGAILYLQRVHYHSFAPYIKRMLSGAKLILDMDDWEIRENPVYLLGVYPTSKAEYLMKKIARRSEACVAASRFLENVLSSYNRKVYYIPSGVDTEIFKFKPNFRRDNKIIFSWIGTLHRRDDVENVGFIIDCFSFLKNRYPSIFLEITGDGIYMDDLKKTVAAYRDESIVLKGWMPPEKIPEYLSSIDIGLLPLIQDKKFNLAKSPSKLFEYMAMGKASVSSKIGEANYIIKDGYNGFLASDKKEFITKMEILIKNKESRLNLGDEALDTVNKNYSLSFLGKQVFNVISDIDKGRYV